MPRWTKRKVTEAAQRALDPKVRRRNTTSPRSGRRSWRLVGIYVWKFGLALPWTVGE
ncbi:TIGR02611 family protein OS=Streptomyces cyaneofuscatus OX=66883 GN=G3I52_28370 PE=4 SV=1 [Streptomyces cyaneofuscatus]